jgi:hypothetical protein
MTEACKVVGGYAAATCFQTIAVRLGVWRKRWGAANVLPYPDPAASGQYTGNTVRCGQTCLTVSVRCDVLGYGVQASREVHQEKQTGEMMTLHFKTVSTISIMTLAIVGMFFAPEARACGVRPASGRGKCLLGSLGTGIRQSLQDETYRLELRTQS